MKSLRDTVSPVNTVYILLAILPPLIVLFRPTLKEFLVLFVVNYISGILTRPVEAWGFRKIWPDVTAYFDGLSDSSVEMMSHQERVGMVESFMSFPSRRAIYVYLGGLIKVLPCASVVAFYWKHEFSPLIGMILFYVLELITFCYFYGIVFVDSHVFLSGRLRQLHERFDFSEVFREVRFKLDRNDTLIRGIWPMASIIVFTLGLQLLIILHGSGDTAVELALKNLLIGGAGITLLYRSWDLRRQFILGGLQRIHDEMKRLDHNLPTPVLPLHSAVFLAQFEQTFNELVRKIRNSEQELRLLAAEESERSRFQFIGEISALIAHDLAGPLHAAQFCTEEIVQAFSNDPFKDARIVEFALRSKANLGRIHELLEALRARLRNPSLQPAQADLLEAHEQVLRLLELQFRGEGFRGIVFEFDPRLHGGFLTISRVDLIHVLDNLYRNACENFFRNSVARPVIRIRLDSVREESIFLRIEDNGTGLSPDQFSALTDATPRRAGLGLRLTRRMVEAYGGILSVALPSEGKGTAILIQLQGRLDAVPSSIPTPVCP